MFLHKTGHSIADTVSDLIGELPDAELPQIHALQGPKMGNRSQWCSLAYGILRGTVEVFNRSVHWFELDKGMWGAHHYDGNYRLSYKGTQPRYNPDAPSELHGQTLEPWREWKPKLKTLICPPTGHVCDFFKIDLAHWFWDMVENKGAYHSDNIIRYKGDENPIDWDNISKVITFNSTVGIEALRRGIEVISDPVHSTIGSYCASINKTFDYDRDLLFNFCQAHMFTLKDKSKICRILKHYLGRE